MWEPFLKIFEERFKFVLNPADESFEPIYALATSLDAFYRATLNEETISRAEDFLMDLLKKDTEVD